MRMIKLVMRWLYTKPILPHFHYYSLGNKPKRLGLRRFPWPRRDLSGTMKVCWLPLGFYIYKKGWFGSRYNPNGNCVIG